MHWRGCCGRKTLVSVEISSSSGVRIDRAWLTWARGGRLELSGHDFRCIYRTGSRGPERRRGKATEVLNKLPWPGGAADKSWGVLEEHSTRQQMCIREPDLIDAMWFSTALAPRPQGQDLGRFVASRKPVLPEPAEWG